MPRGPGAPPSGAQPEGRRGGAPAAVPGTRPIEPHPGRLPPLPHERRPPAGRHGAPRPARLRRSPAARGVRGAMAAPALFRSVQPGRLDDPIDDQRDPLALGAVDEEPEGVAVSYTHLRAHETVLDLVCRLL